MVANLCGHGVGRHIHEEPDIPNVVDRGNRRVFRVGDVFTIEPKCTLEEVPFLIKQRSGVLTIEKWKC